MITTPLISRLTTPAKALVTGASSGIGLAALVERAVIASMTPARSGSFLAWDGQDIVW